MCGLGLCHKPVTGPEKPDCFSDATAFGLKICWHIWKLVPIVNTIPQKKAQNSIYGNLFVTFFRMCQRHRIWIADACRNLFYFCLSHVLQSVTLSGLLRAFEGLCHRPEPAHHYSEGRLSTLSHVSESIGDLFYSLWQYVFRAP